MSAVFLSLRISVMVPQPGQVGGILGSILCIYWLYMPKKDII